MFWLTLVALMVMPEVGLGRAPSSAAVVAYLSMWGIFTAALFIGTLKLGRTLQVFFGLLTMLFVLLAIAGATGNDTLRLVAGYQGILTGAMAIYAGMAKVVKDVYQGKPMTA
jgi:succinate-acetate transporter protein